MALFKYTVTNKEGLIESKEVESPSREDLIKFLTAKGFTIIGIRQIHEFFAPSQIAFFARVSIADKITLTSNLATMVKTGVPLAEAIQTIAEDSSNSQLKKILLEIQKDLENGQPLSQSIRKFPSVFGDIYTSLVRAGEASGKLDEALEAMEVQLRKDNEINAKIKSAMTYPIILLFGVFGVLILMFTFVLPRLVTLFEQTSLKLPFVTRIVLAITKILAARPLLTVIIFILLSIGIALILRVRTVKIGLNQILKNFPVFGELLKNIALTRFSRTLSSLLSSGINIVEALKITAEGVGFPDYRKSILGFSDSTAKGVSLSNAIRRRKELFPLMIASVISAGEKTGKMDELLQKLADFYQNAVDNTLKNLTSLVEPILLIFIGLIIGGIAVSIVLPIYQLIGSIG